MQLLPAFRKSWRSNDRQHAAQRTRATMNQTGTQALEEECESQQEPALIELNQSLEILASVFPHIQTEVFREMLLTFSPESRLHVVTEALLKDETRYAKGRWRLPSQGTSQRGIKKSINTGTINLEEQFRSQSYKNAVKSLFYEEFSGLSRSSIKAVLAERNFSYTASRPILLDMANKSWRYSITNLFSRRKAMTPDQRLVVRHEQLGQLRYILRPIADTQLRTELEETYVAPLNQQIVEEQLLMDQNLAEQFNEQEAEEAEATFDCECCFTSTTFEQIAACQTHGHFICFRCIRHVATEALYGQGWSRSVDVTKSSIKCVAVASDSHDECSGYVPRDSVRHALLSNKDSQPTWEKFEARLTLECLTKSKLNFLSCPFCSYAEERYETTQIKRTQNSYLDRRFAIILAASVIQAFLPPSLTLILVAVVVITFIKLSHKPARLYQGAGSGFLEDVRQPSKGIKTICRNPSCGRAFCTRCSGTWHDVHSCYSSTRQSLRVFVESAVTNAIKRTCPACSVSFVKSSGCNKLVCQCGYAMCYICRADIGSEGYSHFCPHFRPDGGSCNNCTRCDLYKTEDEEIVVEKAKEQAERDWWEQEGANLNEVALRDLESETSVHRRRREKRGISRRK